MMINHCPATHIRANDSRASCTNSQSNCENPLEHIPVVDEDRNTYRSKYFANCHGIRNVSYWGVTVACLDPIQNGTNLEYGSPYLRENCSWYLSPGENITSAQPCTLSTLCKAVVTTKESKKFKDIANKCKSYSQIVVAGSAVYKNFHCASCNGKLVIEFKKPAVNVKKPSLSLFFDYKTLSQDSQHHPGDVPKDDETLHDVIQRYLTVIGLSLSITCLLAVVITYTKFKVLRTLPGLMLLGLSASLIAYQSLLLANPYVTPKSPKCKAMAILLHFTIILSFSWMSVMSYDVTKTFTRKGQREIFELHSHLYLTIAIFNLGRNIKSSFHKYVIIAIVMSLVIVGSAVILQETGAIDIGYGKILS